MCIVSVLQISDYCLFHTRWRAFMILSKIPENERPLVRLKVMAGDLLVGRRADWGVKRNWEGNYLASVSSILCFSYVFIRQHF